MCDRRNIVFTLRFNVVGNLGSSPLILIGSPQPLFWENGFGWSGNNFSITNGSITIDCGNSTGTDKRTECDSLLWIDGNTYYISNNTATFNIVGGAANGCDSLVTLDLTILNTDLNYFTGSIGTWHESSNWTMGVPTRCHNVILPAGCNVEVDSAAICYTLTVQYGAIIIVEDKELKVVSDN